MKLTETKSTRRQRNDKALEKHGFDIKKLDKAIENLIQELKNEAAKG